MELYSQDPTGCEVHNSPTNPPGISISLTSPYINIALNTPLLVDSFGSPGSSCCLTLSNNWSDFDVGLITEKSECETSKTRSGSSTSYCTMRHQKIEQSRNLLGAVRMPVHIHIPGHSKDLLHPQQRPDHLNTMKNIKQRM
ncbi:hypothetical protein EmuJ_000423600 [Echinococcus multilocularis]|uniref:Uncharacterized protein n=1 Tax=Echinococcus multilocularis TaxID=6211 RepID=A0A068Y4A8_ECHMU|nr:hypothetical protein EmuJ_000423600 [Echinococcus multilocularis]